MKIFEVKTDITQCQIIQRDDHFELHQFNCKKMNDIWITDNWYIYNTMDDKCHFYDAPGATIIFDQFIRESELGTFLEMSGEILPVKINNENYFFLNVLNCVNALNKMKTTYQYYEDGTKSSVIEKFHFHSERIGGIPLFKVPETAGFQILCFEGISDPWDEFKGRFEEMGLTGLQFVELYDSDGIK